MNNNDVYDKNIKKIRYCSLPDNIVLIWIYVLAIFWFKGNIKYIEAACLPSIIKGFDFYCKWNQLLK